jgi:hypothetical protein
MERRLDLDIHNQLVSYLAGDSSLQAFRDWFDSSTWDMEETGANQDALRLAGEVELRLAEFSNGHWTEDELRSKLLPLIQTFAQRDQRWGDSAAWYVTSSGNVTQSQGAALGSLVGITASVVFV